MSQSTQIWNASSVLEIITASNDISCAGINLKGLPCGWDLGAEPKQQARHLLISMSQRSPREALNDLPQLARLCLCQKNHQKQAARVVAKWTPLIELYASNLEGEHARRIHQPVGRGGNTSGTSAGGGVRGTRPSGQKLCVDEIIAEMDALSIRQKELRSMLQDAQLSEGGSARTSPFEDITYPVIHTPLSQPSELSESEFSRVGQGQRRGSPSSRDGWRNRVFGRGKPSNQVSQT
tara:strand:- start:1575 stop:2282 length:708 start_codon:yes stop_codon:yes gene_type:complete